MHCIAWVQHTFDRVASTETSQITILVKIQFEVTSVASVGLFIRSQESSLTQNPYSWHLTINCAGRKCDTSILVACKEHGQNDRRQTNYSEIKALMLYI